MPWAIFILTVLLAPRAMETLPYGQFSLQANDVFSSPEFYNSIPQFETTRNLNARHFLWTQQDNRRSVHGPQFNFNENFFRPTQSFPIPVFNPQKTGFQGSPSRQNFPGSRPQRPDNGRPNIVLPPNSEDEEEVFVFDRPTSPRPTRPTTTTTQPTLPTTTTSRNCDCPSTPEYNPVCGSDAVTYNNPGKLKCARLCGTDVSLLYPGACTITQPPNSTTSTTTTPTTSFNLMRTRTSSERG